MDVWGITAVGYVVSLLGAAPGGSACAELVTLDMRRSVAIVDGFGDDVADLFAQEAAAAADLELMRQWGESELRLESAMLVVGTCEVTGGDLLAGQVSLEVVDRLAPVRSIDEDGRYQSLPTDQWSARIVELVEIDGRWRYGTTPAP